jgi:hypothetical protein
MLIKLKNETNENLSAKKMILKFEITLKSAAEKI